MTKPIEPIYRSIGATVEEIRTFLGLRQEDLARKVGMSRAAIASIETGRQRILLHHVATIADALGVPPKRLLRGIWT
jgi:transcriptional regulator with XRE-family HTH domain